MLAQKGYVDEPIEEGLNLVEEIQKLKKQKNAVIMAHYDQRDEIQEIADYIGDSLALAQKAALTDASIIVMCGFHLMGETAKILCPDKKVIVPDVNAGCSLADSCDARDLAEFKKNHPEHIIVSYVNTTAAVKALTDVVVTSSNALKLVNALPADAKILFGPDQNLGSYINEITGRKMDLWNGACHVHKNFSVEEIRKLKAQYPEAKVLVHPECPQEVQKEADKIGSTQGLLNFSVDSEANTFIVATESCILYEMKKRCLQKTFIPAPPVGDATACNKCEYMKYITLEKLYNSLKYELPEVKVDEEIARKAVLPIQKMLEMSK